jgi:YidC/Oxa1 family membrane protein insertase
MEYLGLYKPVDPTLEQPVVDTTEIVIEEAQSSQTGQEITNTEDIAQQIEVIEETLVPVDNDTIIVNTEKYRFTLTSFGGGPVSIILNDYYYRDGEKIEMLPNSDRVTPENNFGGGTFSTSNQLFSSSLMSGEYDVSSEPLDLVYSYKGENGGQINRHFRFYPDQYHYDFNVELVNPTDLGFSGKYNLNWNTPLGTTEPQLNIDYEAMEAVVMQGGSRVNLDEYDNDKLNQSLDGNTAWAGLRSKYFAAVMIPTNRPAESVFANGTKNYITVGENDIEQKLITVGLDMPFANVVSLTDSFTVFVGPLDYPLMEDYGVGLEDMLDIGTTPFIGWIIKPFAIGIMWILPKMYNFIPNYGMVIIIFAFLIKILTLPLSMKSFKSMNAMKELQPKIEEMKKKFKDKPQQLNTEMMKMYKAHGVNPLSGCLPMLPQMPLFFALFSVFRSTILLRNAPFVWFIDDLSRGAATFTDPYIILVLIMIVAQFVSTKLTMASSQQNKAFVYIMPLFMGFIFYKFAAGLVLYWTCFSVFSLLDYVLFKRRQIKNPEVQTT